MPVSAIRIAELAADMIARGESDERTAKRFSQWAMSVHGLEVTRDGAELVIAWQEPRTWGNAEGQRCEVRARSLAVALDEIEAMPRDGQRPE